MTMEKTIDFTQSYVVITMNVTGDSVRKNRRNCQTLREKLKDELAILIGVDGNTIGMIKPKYIKKGLEIKIHIHLNDIHTKDTDYEKVLIEANDNDELAEIIKLAWKLSDNPKIHGIDSMIVESKQRLQQINSNSSASKVDIEMS